MAERRDSRKRGQQRRYTPNKEELVEAWIPKTDLGRKVKSGEVSDISDIMDKGIQIKEAEIVDKILPEIDHDLLLIGQAKGKFGGGKRRAFRQTQKKTAEGNKPKFTTMVVCGNHDGIVGLGMGSSRETVPAREKAIRNSKTNITKIKRGCGSWECGCGEAHTIPFKVKGKCSSVIIELMPAPKGVGLCINDECKKVMEFAGIKDVWSKTYGQTSSRINLIKACFSALKQLSIVKVSKEYEKISGTIEGKK